MLFHGPHATDPGALSHALTFLTSPLPRTALQALPSSATLLTDLGLTSSQLLNVTSGTPPDT